MNGMNKVTLLGNIGNDPDLKMVGPGGVYLLKLRLATNEFRASNDGQGFTHTEWHDVSVWGRRAESLAKVLKKGDCILVEGQLRTSSYDSKEGVRKYRTDVRALDIMLTGGKKKMSSRDTSYAQPPLEEDAYASEAELASDPTQPINAPSQNGTPAQTGGYVS